MYELTSEGKKAYFENLDSSKITDNKKFWKTIKLMFSKKCVTKEGITLVKEDEIVSESQAIAELFNKLFANILTELNLAIDEDLLENVNHISDPVLRAIEKYKNHPSVKAISEKYNENTFNFEHVSLDEIIKKLLGNFDHVVVSVSIDFPTNSQQDAPFHRIAYDYSRFDWDGLCDDLRDVPWEDIRKLGASAAASEFCEWIQVGIDVYIPYRKYQVKSHSSPWFSTACATAIVHINHFFRLYQREKSSDSKVKFRQASNRCERVLEAAKLAYANKTKESITSQKLGSRDFWQIANSVLNKGKSAIPPLFNGSEVLSSASDKAKLFPENFSLNSNLDDSGVSLPAFPSRTNLKLHNISITPKMVRKVVMNLDLSKASGPDCIPVVVLKNFEPELSYY